MWSQIFIKKHMYLTEKMLSLKSINHERWDLGPVYMEVEDPQVGEVTRLSGVTRLSI